LLIGNADNGTIEFTVSASGKPTPLNEEIVVSPVSSRILEVYKKPGDSIFAGEPLLKLDLTSVETEYNQKLDEYEVLKSQEIQVRVNLENSLSELNMQLKLKEMQVKQLQADLESEKYLLSIGAGTEDKVRRAELNYEEAQLYYQQLVQKIENERKHAEAELQIKRLGLNIFERTLSERARLLKNARVLSPKTAILTFILDQIGTQISDGTQLAIISDLSSFKVECEIADGHREKISPGAKALISIGNIRQNGTIVSVTPSVTNGLINFTVIPEDSSHPGLRGGLSADVNIFYGIVDDVVRIPNSRFINLMEGDAFLWVIEGRKAVKRRVTLGKASFEYVEVIHGLKPVERVILSDMERYRNKNEVLIK